MKTKVVYIIPAEELEAKIPYKPLVEVWDRLNTLSGKRIMSSLSISKDALRPLYRKAYKWYLVTGAPQNAEFSKKELELWDKVGQLICLLP